MQSILAVGNDENLLLTRAAVLGKIGAEVSSASTNVALELIKAKRFDAVVLCHTLTLTEARALTHAARASSEQIHVVQIAPLGTPAYAFNVASVDMVVEPHPTRLVDCIVALLNTVEARA